MLMPMRAVPIVPRASMVKPSRRGGSVLRSAHPIMQRITDRKDVSWAMTHVMIITMPTPSQLAGHRAAATASTTQRASREMARCE